MNYSLIIIVLASIATLASVIIMVLHIISVKKRGDKVQFRSISIQLLAITVWVAILSNIFIPSQTLEGNTELGLGFFTLAIVVGVFLIRSILREILIENSVEHLINRLHDHNVNLENLDEQKNEFISLASHQLRTPLVSIIGHSEMILEGDFGEISDEVREVINRIYKSSNSLGLMVNDFLNVNHIEKGEMEYIIKDVDVCKDVSPVVQSFKDRAEDKGLEFINQCDNISIRADVNKLKQIVSNLLDNAIKYTPRGSIEYICKEVDGKALITIKDSGIGIDDDMREHIFSKFIRDDDAIKIDVQGSGLGLYIASVMVEAMGGKIWAESAGKGEGSTFYVELPLVKS